MTENNENNKEQILNNNDKLPYLPKLDEQGDVIMQPNEGKGTFEPLSGVNGALPLLDLKNPLNRDILGYSDSFNRCFQFILDREGRILENVTNDPGGLTKFGISQKSYPNLDIKNLTEGQAKEIYYKNYWLPMDCDNYEVKMALALFDTSVNQGVGTAKLILSDVSDRLNVEVYLLRRLRYYFNLCQKNNRLFVFLKDWVLRVIKVSEFN